MHCGAKYPDEPPAIQFVSQVNLPCVNPHNGVVDPKQLPCLAQWKRDNTMETILIELRRCVSPYVGSPEAYINSNNPQSTIQQKYVNQTTMKILELIYIL